MTDAEAPAPAPAPQQRGSPRAVLAYRGFMSYQAARLLSMVGMQMIAVAIGWQVYGITHEAKSLAYVGLAQFLAAAFCAPITGLVADRLNRKMLLFIAHALIVVGALSLYGFSVLNTKTTWPVYVVCALLGSARSLGAPAGQALMPSLVPRELFALAVAWASTSIQLATIVGPALGGLVFGINNRPEPVYLSCAAALTLSLGCIFAIKPVPRSESVLANKPRLIERDGVLSGLRYVWSNKPVLGVISLDLFAVLLGGAVALLPIFAKERLHMDARGLGLLRSAPALGAALMAIGLAYFPMRRRAGARMFIAVFIFGIATIVFGLSQNLWISLAALVITGAADMISVVVRLTLVQLKTPDEMRGRVSAVNSVFIGASNELGEFESGITAQWLGPVAAVVLGGIGTCVVVSIWAWLFPQIRKIDDLDEA